MKINIRKSALLVSLFSILLFLVGYFSVSSASVISLRSPNKIYRIDFFSDKAESFLPSLSHSIKFDLYRNDKQIVRRATLIYYDGERVELDKKYAYETWEDENVLRLSSDASERVDRIIISNET